MDETPRNRADVWIDRWSGSDTLSFHPLGPFILHFLFEIMSDNWKAEEDGALTRQLCPPALARWLQDDGFVSRMSRSSLDMARRLEAGDRGITTCTADEVNLAIATELAVTGLQLLEDDPVVDVLLKRFGPVDIEREIASIREHLSWDTDIDMLWDPSLDGIENESALLRATGVVNLHPSEWFTPFDQGEKS